MAENINMHWFFVTAAIVIAALLWGQITSRSLPPEKKKKRINKILAACLALFATYFFVSVPFVYYGAHSDFSQHLKDLSEKSSTEEITKRIQEQNSQIEDLKRDIKDLKNELYQTHQHYQLFLQMVFSLVLAYGAIRIFDRDQNDSSEIN